MRVLVLGLNPEKQPELEREFPALKFNCERFKQTSRRVRNVSKGHYDLVISMSCFIGHSDEITIRNGIGETPFRRCSGSMSALKRMLSNET
jgi:hypothetical protein